jgi:hypothetical protein
MNERYTDKQTVQLNLYILQKLIEWNIKLAKAYLYKS